MPVTQLPHSIRVLLVSRSLLAAMATGTMGIIIVGHVRLTVLTVSMRLLTAPSVNLRSRHTILASVNALVTKGTTRVQMVSAPRLRLIAQGQQTVLAYARIASTLSRMTALQTSAIALNSLRTLKPIRSVSIVPLGVALVHLEPSAQDVCPAISSRKQKALAAVTPLQLIMREQAVKCWKLARTASTTLAIRLVKIVTQVVLCAMI